MIFCFPPIASAQQQPEAKSLDVYFIDVMGGAATLIVTPDNESVLIDSGWPGLTIAIPKRIVHVLKDLAGCDHLDHLVTTHWHTDHFGGVAGLARLVGSNTSGIAACPRMTPWDSTSPTAREPTIRWASLTARPAGQAQGAPSRRYPAAEGRALRLRARQRRQG